MYITYSQHPLQHGYIATVPHTIRSPPYHSHLESGNSFNKTGLTTKLVRYFFKCCATTIDLCYMKHTTAAHHSSDGAFVFSIGCACLLQSLHHHHHLTSLPEAVKVFVPLKRGGGTVRIDSSDSILWLYRGK